MKRAFSFTQLVLIGMGFVVVLVGLGVGVFLTRSRQDIRQQAAGNAPTDLATPNNCNPATHCCNVNNCDFIRYVYRQP